jgi:hypothetical protein
MALPDPMINLQDLTHLTQLFAFADEVPALGIKTQIPRTLFPDGLVMAVRNGGDTWGIRGKPTESS